MSFGGWEDDAFFSRAFSSPNDRESRAWVMTSAPMEQLTKIPEVIRAGGRAFYIFNEFGNRQPHIFNYDYLHLGRNEVKFTPTVLCDSNVASLLHRRVAHPSKLSSDDFATAQELLKTFLLHELDFNSMFYLLESSAKVPLDGFEEFAGAVDRSFLVLHSMDREHFLATGEIKESIPLRRVYQNEFDAVAFGDIVAKRFSRVEGGVQRPECDLLYACLLKMVFIHKGPGARSTIEEKIRRFRDFMVREMGAVMGRLALIAPEYFAGILDNFISFQKNADVEGQLRRLRAAAWDLFLLTLPATLLAAGDQDHAILTMICTGDRALQRIGRSFSFEALLAIEGQPCVPMIGYDYTALIERLGEARVTAMTEEAIAFGRERAKSRPARSRHLQVPDLATKLAALENDVRGLTAATT